MPKFGRGLGNFKIETRRALQPGKAGCRTRITLKNEHLYTKEWVILKQQRQSIEKLQNAIHLRCLIDMNASVHNSIRSCHLETPEKYMRYNKYGKKIA